MANGLHRGTAVPDWQQLLGDLLEQPQPIRAFSFDEALVVVRETVHQLGCPMTSAELTKLTNDVLNALALNGR